MFVVQWVKKKTETKTGQKQGKKRKHRSLVADDSDDGVVILLNTRRIASRDDQVKDLIEELKMKHGVSAYTSMQYRAE